LQARFSIDEPVLLGYCAVWLSNYSPTFRRSILPSSSESIVCEMDHNTNEGGRLPRNLVKKLRSSASKSPEGHVPQQLLGGSLELLFSYC